MKKYKHIFNFSIIQESDYNRLPEFQKRQYKLVDDNDNWYRRNGLSEDSNYSSGSSYDTGSSDYSSGSSSNDYSSGSSDDSFGGFGGGDFGGGGAGGDY